MSGKVMSRLLGVVGYLLLLVAAGAAIYLLWPRQAGEMTGQGGHTMAGMAMPGEAATGEAQAGAGAHEGHAPAGQAPAKPAGKVQYHCPMHPNYVSDRPGTCPICGMDLVPVKEEETAPSTAAAQGRATVTISPQRQQLIGVRTGTVEKKQVTRTIRAVGTVQYNERALSTVSLRFGGWIEELMVKAVGDEVHKGAPLFVIYSPEVLEAQRNCLLARETVVAVGENASAETKALAEESLRSARGRLTLWEIPEDQIKQLEAGQAPKGLATIFAKVDGIVISRNIVLGAYAEASRDLYALADLSTVWLQADVYEYEMPLVKVGQEARMLLSSMPGEGFAGTVSYVYPYLNEATRTVRVRLEFPNPQGTLKPGMYATVLISADLGEQLVVDDNAILDTGVRQIAFVDLGEGRFEPRELTVGQRADRMTVILKGLAEGEKVVTSANFLIDSESQLKAALQMGAQGGEHHH
jgi:Cu(I)/Ag(I) efflux system membrane fusion protein